MLHTRKNRVIMVTPNTSYEITLSREEALIGSEIEEKIVTDIVSFEAESSANFQMTNIFCVCSCFRYKNTKTTSTRPHRNDQCGREQRSKLNAAWQCHIFVAVLMRVLDENTNVYWRRRIVSLDASSLSVGTKKTDKKKI